MNAVVPQHLLQRLLAAACDDQFLAQLFKNCLVAEDILRQIVHDEDFGFLIRIHSASLPAAD